MIQSTHRDPDDLDRTGSASPRPIFWFVASWFLATMLISGLLVLLQKFGGIDSTYISIVQFAPMIAFLVFLTVFRTRTAALSPSVVGAREFLLRCLVAAGVIGAYAASIVVLSVLSGATRHASPFDPGWLLLAYVVLQTVRCLRRGAPLAWLPAAGVGDPDAVALSILFGSLVTGNIWQRGFTAGIMHAVVNVTLFLAVDPSFSEFKRLLLPLFFLAGCATVYLVARHSVSIHRTQSCGG